MTLLNQIKTSSKFLNTSYSNRSQHVGLHDCQDVVHLSVAVFDLPGK